MKKMKIRKDVALIVGGAVLTIASFGINWSIASSIDARSRVIDEQLLDIDRFLTFSRSATLEAFEHNSSAQTCIATSQVMFFQLSPDQPNPERLRIYQSQVQAAITSLARAATAAHAAATGLTIAGEELDEITKWSDSTDHANAIAKLNAMFNGKLTEYQIASDQQVKLRRKLLKIKNEWAVRRSTVGHLTQLLQLLGILTILAKDLVTAGPGSPTQESQLLRTTIPATSPTSIAA